MRENGNLPTKNPKSLRNFPVFMFLVCKMCSCRTKWKLIFWTTFRYISNPSSSGNPQFEQQYFHYYYYLFCLSYVLIPIFMLLPLRPIYYEHKVQSRLVPIELFINVMAHVGANIWNSVVIAHSIVRNSFSHLHIIPMNDWACQKEHTRNTSSAHANHSGVLM